MPDILNDYETFVIHVEVVRDSLLLLEHWLNCVPSFDKMESYYDLVIQHPQHYALLSLAMDKLDYLIAENRKIIDKSVKC